MSTNRAWSLDPKCLSSALDRWYQDDPDQGTKDRVHNWLMDCLDNALVGMGQEDPPGSGVFYGRVPETNVGVTYVPTVESHSVCVAIIMEFE